MITKFLVVALAACIAGNTDAAGNNVGIKSKIDLDTIPSFMKKELEKTQEEIQKQLNKMDRSYDLSPVPLISFLGLTSLIILRSMMDSMKNADGGTKNRSSLRH